MGVISTLTVTLQLFVYYKYALNHILNKKNLKSILIL